MKNKISTFRPPCQHEKVVYDGITGRYFCEKCEVELQDCNVQGVYTPCKSFRVVTGRGSWLVLSKIK